MRVVILVNGLPGAGKSTLARGLARELGLPLFSKDAIKEAHADVLGSGSPDGRPQRKWNNALGAAASETMWALLADAPGGAVLESFWPASVREFVVAGFRRGGGGSPVEVWCEVPAELAWRRYQDRHPRHPIHGELLTDDEWAGVVRDTRPLALGPVLRVDTTAPVDTADLADRLRALA